MTYKMKCPKCDYKELWNCMIAEYERRKEEKDNLCPACKQNGRGDVELQQYYGKINFILSGDCWERDGYKNKEEQ